MQVPEKEKPLKKCIFYFDPTFNAYLLLNTTSNQQGRISKDKQAF